MLWLGFYYWTVVVQKVLSAKSLDHGRWGALFAGFMQLPLLVLLIFPGVLARGVYDELDNPDMAWPAPTHAHAQRHTNPGFARLVCPSTGAGIE